MKLLVVDFETTGFGSVSAACEIAGALIETESRKLISLASTLLPVESVDTQAEAIHGISAELSQASTDWNACVRLLETMAGAASYVVAHNKAFDFEYAALTAPGLTARPWICTLEDFDWKGHTSRKLSHLALDYGVQGGFLAAHRAAADVLMLSELLFRLPDLDERIRLAVEPKVMIIADINYNQYKAAQDILRPQLLERGFAWDRVVKRHWAVIKPQSLVLDFISECPFPVMERSA